MLQQVRRIFAWIYASLPLVLLFAAPALRDAEARGAEWFLRDANPVSADPTRTNLLVFGVLGLAAASAAIAVRMVRRSH
jgi:hypothetical protein